MQHDLCRIDGRVGTVIARTVPYDIPGLEYAREIFVLDNDGRIGFVVFQQHVVPGTILLDQVILQKKCILFRVDNKIFDVPYLLDQDTCFVAVVFFVEIGGNATLQVLCFAYIDDRSLLVKVLVAAWRFRYDRKDVFICSSVVLISFASVSILFSVFYAIVVKVNVSRGTFHV